jgi:hypothetical protein
MLPIGAAAPARVAGVDVKRTSPIGMANVVVKG